MFERWRWGEGKNINQIILITHAAWLMKCRYVRCLCDHTGMLHRRWWQHVSCVHCLNYYRWSLKRVVQDVDLPYADDNKQAFLTNSLNCYAPSKLIIENPYFETVFAKSAIVIYDAEIKRDVHRGQKCPRTDYKCLPEQEKCSLITTFIRNIFIYSRESHEREVEKCTSDKSLHNKACAAPCRYAGWSCIIVICPFKSQVHK